jgi:hypothetical protein
VKVQLPVKSIHLISVHLTEQEDVFKWGLTVSGIFSVKTMYLDLLNGHTVFLKKYIWKIKVLKIKIFTWFLHKGGNSYKR